MYLKLFFRERLRSPYMSINTRRASTNPEINLQTQKNALCPSERYVANAPKTMEMHFSIAISYQRCLGNELEQMLRVSRQSKEQRKVLKVNASRAYDCRFR